MLCEFRQLDGVRRPVVSVRLLPGGRVIDCLVDTGSPVTCLPRSFAEFNGVRLADDPTEEYSLIVPTRAWQAPVRMWLTDDKGSQEIGPLAATVRFCDPWVRKALRTGSDGQPETVDEPRGFGLLGMAGCLDQLKLTVWAHLGLFQLEREGFDEPVPRALGAHGRRLRQDAALPLDAGSGTRRD